MSAARRLTVRLEPGGPCIAVAEQQPDNRWLVNGRAMSRAHAVVVLEAAVTVAAASRLPHRRKHVPPQAASHPGTLSGQTVPPRGRLVARATELPDSAGRLGHQIGGPRGCDRLGPAVPGQTMSWPGRRLLARPTVCPCFCRLGSLAAAAWLAAR